MASKRETTPDRQQNIIRLFPNMATILGLCAGLSSLRFALSERWEYAVGFLLIAACIDAFDGRLARLLNSTSVFGAQLDSLSDFVNFGVIPPIILYLWTTHGIKGWGWALVLFFAICAAIRLARFNTNIGKNSKQPWRDRFFVGIPSPAGAGLALLPLVLSFEFGDEFLGLFLHNGKSYLPLAVISYSALVAIGMVSTLPTLSFKKITFKPEFTSLLLAMVGIIGISFITAPWLTLSVIFLLYIATLPLGAWRHYRLSQNKP